MAEAHQQQTGPVVAEVDRGLVEVRGQDRATYLHAVLSQDVVDLEPGRVAGALQLDAQGRPLAMVDVAALADRLVLLTPSSAAAEELAANLGSRTFLADASLHARDVAAWALRGERGQEVAAAAGLAVAPGTVREAEGVLLVGRSGGLDVVGPRDEGGGIVDRLRGAGAIDGGAEAIEAWRVAHGVPAWGREVRAPHLPEEAGLLPTHVHLDKGCYPGQEAVARMWMLGRPRRRLARVALTGAADAGWAAGSGKRGVEVTSAATWAGQRVGLAYVPPTAAPGDRLGDDDAGVVVRELVGEGEAVPGHDPSVPRRRDRRRAG
jgi:folate-binding protein YgfZ